MKTLQRLNLFTFSKWLSDEYWLYSIQPLPHANDINRLYAVARVSLFILTREKFSLFDPNQTELKRSRSG
jgi:hypothetical protein